MKKLNKKNKGFIIIFVLMMVSLIVFLTQQLVSGVLVTSNFVSIVMQRDQARLLALGGIDIAINKLLELDHEDKKDDQEKEKEKQENSDDKEDEKISGQVSKLSVHDKKFLGQIFPYLNRWQTFAFDEKIDGFAGQLKLCLSCEEGKINLNEAFDFKKQEFKKEYGTLLKSLEIKGILAAGELATKLQEFLVERARKLEDLSELTAIAACKELDIFYKPPEAPTQKGEEAKPSPNIALTDIFTIWSGTELVTPLLFSDALCAIFGFRRPLADDPEKMKDAFKEFKEKFGPGVARNWDASWEILQPIFDQKPVFLKEMEAVFSKEFGPRCYSVLSYASIGKVTQRLLAIIKKVPLDKPKKTEKAEQAAQSDASKKSDDEKKKNEFEFKILRLYWI